MQIELLCSYKYKTLNPAGYKISFSQAVLYSFWCKWKRDIKLAFRCAFRCAFEQLA